MLDPQRLRDAKAELVVVSEHAELREIEGVRTGLEVAATEIGPATPRDQRGAPPATEVVPRLGIEEHRGRASAAERVAHAPAEHRLLLFEPAEAEGQPVGAE